MNHPTTQLRSLLERPGIIPSLAAHDAFSARIMVQAGVELLFLGGFGVSASRLGLPDVGLLTQTEMVSAIHQLTETVSVPVIADADTGHGEAINIARTVQEFERAGAAGLLIEDQVFPKRCGHFSGKQVVADSVARDRVKIALDARRNSDFVIIARTDARAVLGLEAAISRANSFRELGADVCFVEAPQTIDELKQVGREVHAQQLANMLVGGATPILSVPELQELGFKIAVAPIESLAIAGFAIRQLATTWLKTGRVDSLAAQMLTFDEIKQVLNVTQFTNAASAS